MLSLACAEESSTTPYTGSQKQPDTYILPISQTFPIFVHSAGWSESQARQERDGPRSRWKSEMFTDRTNLSDALSPRQLLQTRPITINRQQLAHGHKPAYHKQPTRYLRLSH
ncbi:hypothetical protein VTN96DRAFT_8219 [Rasamsonia emersonii]